jgi:hypothetical protein
MSQALHNDCTQSQLSYAKTSKSVANIIQLQHAMLLPAPGEEEQEKGKKQLPKTARLARGIFKPFVHHSTEGCQVRSSSNYQALHPARLHAQGNSMPHTHAFAYLQLHLKLLYNTWTPQETTFIKKAVRQGVRRTLRSEEGRRVAPGLRSLLQSGMLHVRGMGWGVQDTVGQGLGSV